MIRKILYASFAALLLTAVAPEGKTTVIPAEVQPEPTEFVLSVPDTEPDVEKEMPTVQVASVEEDKESSTFISLKSYMEMHDLPGDTAAKYAGIIEKYAEKYEVDPYLVLAVIHVETGSTYKNNTKPNSHGAVGLMQIREVNVECNNKPGGCYNKVFEGYTKEDLKDPDRNIELGVSYLKYLQDRFGYELGITAYNQGEGNVAKKKYRKWYTKKVLYALECIEQGKENRY